MRPNTEDLLLAARAFARQAVWSVTSHVPGGEPDIAVFGSREGGTDWLVRHIARQRGVRPLHGPDSAATPGLTPGQYERIPKFESGELVDLDDEEQGAARAWFEAVLAGAVPVNAPTRPWRPEFDLRSNRLVLELLSSKAMIDWFDRTYDLRIVVMTRHPIPQALDGIRSRRPLTVYAYLRNQRFEETRLSDKQLRLCYDVLDHGSLLERYVLNWALEYLVPLRLLPERARWLWVSYEECADDPAPVLRRLAGELGLSEVSAATMTDGRVPPLRPDRWRHEVSPDDERAALGILLDLGIPLYVAGEPAPQRAALDPHGAQRVH